MKKKKAGPCEMKSSILREAVRGKLAYETLTGKRGQIREYGCKCGTRAQIREYGDIYWNKGTYTGTRGQMRENGVKYEHTAIN
jgi:hypothetical protein